MKNLILILFITLLCNKISAQCYTIHSAFVEYEDGEIFEYMEVLSISLLDNIAVRQIYPESQKEDTDEYISQFFYISSFTDVFKANDTITKYINFKLVSENYQPISISGKYDLESGLIFYVYNGILTKTNRDYYIVGNIYECKSAKK